METSKLVATCWFAAIIIVGVTILGIILESRIEKIKKEIKDLKK